jgi:hypothetical protein
MADDYNEPTPGFAEEIQRALGGSEAPPEQPAAPRADPALQEWEALRRRRKGANAAPPEPVETQPDPNVGLSPLAQELEREGWFGQLAAQNAAERESERRAAIRQSAEAAAQEAARYGGGDAPELYPGEAEATRNAGAVFAEAPRWVAQHLFQLPGSIVAGGGSVLQAPDVTIAAGQYGGQATRQRQLALADAIDRGESYSLRQPGSYSVDTPLVMFANQYRSAGPEDRARMRASLQSEIAAFNPTPIQQRPLYRAGEAMQETGRNLVPHLEGYNEQSVATQLSRGLGSMIVGMPVAMISGPAGVVGGAAVFGAMGIGEATQSAVEFDRRERAAGREGISQEQIVLAGILGVAPGTTDILPVEVMLNRLRIPGVPPAANRILARAVASVGGRTVIQALTEGGQEAFQQILQNLITQQVYNPNQELTENTWWNAVIGAGVGAESELGRTALASLARLGRGRGGRAATQPPTAAPTSVEGGWQQAETETRAATAPPTLPEGAYADDVAWANSPEGREYRRQIRASYERRYRSEPLDVLGNRDRMGWVLDRFGDLRDAVGLGVPEPPNDPELQARMTRADAATRAALVSEAYVIDANGQRQGEPVIVLDPNYFSRDGQRFARVQQPDGTTSSLPAEQLQPTGRESAAVREARARVGSPPQPAAPAVQPDWDAFGASAIFRLGDHE